MRSFKFLLAQKSSPNSIKFIFKFIFIIALYNILNSCISTIWLSKSRRCETIRLRDRKLHFVTVLIKKCWDLCIAQMLTAWRKHSHWDLNFCYKLYHFIFGITIQQRFLAMREWARYFVSINIMKLRFQTFWKLSSSNISFQYIRKNIELK